MTVNYITEPIPSAMGKGKGGWRGKIADGTVKSGVCDKVFNNTAVTLDFHWPEDIPDEAVGRDIELTFRLSGGDAARVPVVRRRTVRLYAA